MKATRCTCAKPSVSFNVGVAGKCGRKPLYQQPAVEMTTQGRRIHRHPLLMTMTAALVDLMVVNPVVVGRIAIIKSLLMKFHGEIADLNLIAVGEDVFLHFLTVHIHAV